jgi:hypothetical protein
MLAGVELFAPFAPAHVPWRLELLRG